MDSRSKHTAKARSVEALAGQWVGVLAEWSKHPIKDAFDLAEEFVEEADRRLREAHEKDEQERSDD